VESEIVLELHSQSDGMRQMAPIVRDGIRVDLVDDLRDAILRLETAHPSAATLSLGGWKSAEILSWRDPSAIELRAAIADCVDVELAIRPAHVSGWAMINRSGDCHPRHVHQGAIWSGVYYVDAGDEPLTPTMFEASPGRDVAVIPVPGRLVLFPGDMWHSVPALPYCAGTSGSPRITIAFDVRR
jgi:hypothetical protein